MPFIVKAQDYPDAGERRKATREAHLDALHELKIGGQLLYAAAMMDDKGQVKGSMLILNLESRSDVEIYLETEPYVLNQVWGKIDIIPCRPAPGFETAKK